MGPRAVVSSRLILFHVQKNVVSKGFVLASLENQGVYTFLAREQCIGYRVGAK